MAHELKEPQTLRLHQALHGYDDGHRQLALSAPLKPRDQKTLLALSDISGAGALLHDDGYLTGYPLQDSGFFAFARTWPAPEMPRPGCVWTHTLLIDFTDLAALDMLSGLSDLFKRPSGFGPFLDYGTPKRLELAPQVGLQIGLTPIARQVMAALYGRPRSRVVMGLSGSDHDDKVVIAIWSQQWPRLRRSFRFCTFAIRDRSIEGESFDLQFLPRLRQSGPSRFSDVIHAASVEPPEGVWLEDAVGDLLSPDGEGLRSFLRRVGSDLTLGREAFRPLCRLHRALSAAADPNGIHDAISILSDLGTEQARTARVVVAKAALELVETLDTPSFDFLWQNLHNIEPSDLRLFATRLGRSVWRRDPKRLIDLLDSDSESAALVERTVAVLESDELIDGLRNAPELVGVVLTCRPNIVGQARFWTDLNIGDAPFEAARHHALQHATVNAILESGRSDLAPRATREFGATVALQALALAPKAARDRLEAWVQAAATDIAAVAEFLAGQPHIPRQILHSLARTLPPDAVPNDYGSDPWLEAWLNSTGSIDEDDNIYVGAYLLSRALGVRSRSPAELAQLSFEITHGAAANNRLSEESWRVVESRLPWSLLWFEWDKCKRLRAGITDLFVDRDLEPSLFARLVEDDHLFFALATEAAQSRRGRAYLTRVRQAIAAESNSVLNARIRAVEELLN